MSSDLLRQSKLGRQEEVWTKDQVISGLLKFYEEHGRFPKSLECDNYPYLPTGRTIQRNFGGIAALRTELGINESYASGAYRASIAREVGLRGRLAEETFYKQCVDVFGEVAVHREFPLQGGRFRLDIVVYHKTGKIGADIFFAKDLKNLRTLLFTKIGKYTTFPWPVYLVSANPEIKQSDVVKIVSGMHQGPSVNEIAITVEEFWIRVGDLRPLKIE